MFHFGETLPKSHNKRPFQALVSLKGFFCALLGMLWRGRGCWALEDLGQGTEGTKGTKRTTAALSFLSFLSFACWPWTCRTDTMKQRFGGDLDSTG